mmetsp:Transcript_6814/g.20553  ORF Transcript_6814/g.20553 Transcript_6814/m.20553 type:complete len:208 (-) Transcript_6814:294-917(-)
MPAGAAATRAARCWASPKRCCWPWSATARGSRSRSAYSRGAWVEPRCLLQSGRRCRTAVATTAVATLAAVVARAAPRAGSSSGSHPRLCPCPAAPGGPFRAPRAVSTATVERAAATRGWSAAWVTRAAQGAPALCPPSMRPPCWQPPPPPRPAARRCRSAPRPPATGDFAPAQNATAASAPPWPCPVGAPHHWPQPLAASLRNAAVL